MIVMAAYAVGAILTSAVLCRAFLKPDSVFHVLDHPNERSLHSAPVPRSGGVAMAMAILIWGLAVWFTDSGDRQWIYAAAGFAVLVALGVVDDRTGVATVSRFLVHLGVASLAAYGGYQVAGCILPGMCFQPGAAFDGLLTVLLLGWMTNLYNFMDGMDGFAGGMTVIGFGALAVLGAMSGNGLYTWINFVIAGVALGFLRYNFPPARIFMGDAGSAPLGFLAGVDILYGQSHGIFPLWVGGLAFSPFVVDASVTLFRRTLQGEVPWRAHRSHYYQRLVRAGWSHRRTVLWEYCLMAAAGASAVCSVLVGTGGQWAILLSWVVVYMALIGFVGARERKEYRGVWRFASIPDIVRIGKAVLLGLTGSAIALFLLTRMADVPRSVLPLYGLILVLLLGVPRLAYRWFKDHHLYVRAGRRVLIVGAGRAGDMLAREMLRVPEHDYIPIGFVDDAVSKQGREIHGIRVLGGVQDVPRLVPAYGIGEVIIAVPSADAQQMQRMVDLCEQAEVPCKTLPPMDRLVSTGDPMKTLREVSIEDLLGRDPIQLDWKRIADGLTDKTVLITGGGGSIGSELCRQIAGLRPKALVVLEQNEYNLYTIERELLENDDGLVFHGCLGDVTDRVAVEHVMATYEPKVVFHAAAYKHVPMLEGQTREAVNNNVVGTQIVAAAADEHRVQTFVLISTDKAVNPSNLMGATKRIAEIYCQNMNCRSQTNFITVRFGNVLGSAGSVVPLFRQQIHNGGPVTVTHPEITRYFMTIPEACQLIMQSAAMGKGGEIFVLDMGKPVKITFLAEQMIRLSGREPHKDIEIVYTGLRPGEKLFEELFHEKEALSGTEHEKILLAQHRPVDWAGLEETLQRIREACGTYDENALGPLVTKLVPELHGAVHARSDNVIPLTSNRTA
ncbi:MAG: polysaccharide biosynthesis protein [Gammaproteobacteria bacterium]